MFINPQNNIYQDNICVCVVILAMNPFFFLSRSGVLVRFFLINHFIAESWVVTGVGVWGMT